MRNNPVASVRLRSDTRQAERAISDAARGVIRSANDMGDSFEESDRRRVRSSRRATRETNTNIESTKEALRGVELADPFEELAQSANMFGRRAGESFTEGTVAARQFSTDARRLLEQVDAVGQDLGDNLRRALEQASDGATDFSDEAIAELRKLERVSQNVADDLRENFSDFPSVDASTRSSATVGPPGSSGDTDPDNGIGVGRVAAALAVQTTLQERRAEREERQAIALAARRERQADAQASGLRRALATGLRRANVGGREVFGASFAADRLDRDRPSQSGGRIRRGVGAAGGLAAGFAGAAALGASAVALTGAAVTVTGSRLAIDDAQLVGQVANAAGVTSDGGRQAIDSAIESVARLGLANVSREEIGQNTALAATLFDDLDVADAGALAEISTGITRVAEATQVSNEQVLEGVRVLRGQGASTDEALNIVAALAQDDPTGDSVDAIREFAATAAQTGFSPEEFAAFQVQAREAGATNTDRSADLLLQARVRLTEGGDDARAALEEIGLNADEILGQFDQGGETAQAALQEIVAALADLEAQGVDALSFGERLLGTPFEDLGLSATQLETILAGLESTTSDVASAYDGLAESQDGAFGAGARRGLAAVRETFSNTFDSVLPLLDAAGDSFERIAPSIEELTSNYIPVLIEALSDLLPVLENLVTEDVLPFLLGLIEDFGPVFIGLTQALGASLPLLFDLFRVLFQVTTLPLRGFAGAIESLGISGGDVAASFERAGLFIEGLVLRVLDLAQAFRGIAEFFGFQLPTESEIQALRDALEEQNEDLTARNVTRNITEELERDLETRFGLRVDVNTDEVQEAVRLVEESGLAFADAIDEAGIREALVADISFENLDEQLDAIGSELSAEQFTAFTEVVLSEESLRRDTEGFRNFEEFIQRIPRGFREEFVDAFEELSQGPPIFVDTQLADPTLGIPESVEVEIAADASAAVASVQELRDTLEGAAVADIDRFGDQLVSNLVTELEDLTSDVELNVELEAEAVIQEEDALRSSINEVISDLNASAAAAENVTVEGVEVIVDTTTRDQPVVEELAESESEFETALRDYEDALSGLFRDFVVSYRSGETEFSEATGTLIAGFERASAQFEGLLPPGFASEPISEARAELDQFITEAGVSIDTQIEMEVVDEEFRDIVQEIENTPTVHEVVIGADTSELDSTLGDLVFEFERLTLGDLIQRTFFDLDPLSPEVNPFNGLPVGVQGPAAPPEPVGDGFGGGGSGFADQSVDNSTTVNIESFVTTQPADSELVRWGQYAGG